ncbi:MAG: YhcN/YlaJ family sporulation lipoprotein [Syntrophomonas sp.]|nr:YhcN/YlaJ family sporulation lipoprotein [Syntrophomonas sp.]
MKTLRSTLIMFMTLLIGICLVVGGCNSAAKKPIQPIPSAPMPASPEPNNPVNPNTPSSAQPSTMEVANRAVIEADKVMQVNKAAAIVQDNIIYIGLDLKANLGKQKIAATEKNVVDRVKKIETGYTVRVTSDMATVAAIKTIAEGIAEGKPMTSFKKEMDMIMMKMVPNGL